MAEGASRAGLRVVVLPQDRWQGSIDADIGCFYGLEGNTPAIFERYRTGATAVYIDLGYWGRREGGRWTGYHKLVVNDRHPNAYLWDWEAPPDRLARFHVEPKARRAGGNHVVLCGMSDKGARSCGYEPEQWERQAIAAIRKHTNRPIIYRPKPSWKGAKPIEGTHYSSKLRTFEQELECAHCVVTRHSNCALEALLAGVPAHATEGVAATVVPWNLDRIEAPPMPSADMLRQLAQNVAYCQWSIAEMRDGLPWQHLIERGLI